MIYELEDFKGNKIILKDPISVEITMDEGAPADSIEVRFPINLNSEEYKIFVNDQLTKIRVYDDKKTRVVLNGIVDEQIVSVNSSGVSLIILGRSSAALLLDNEAQPQTYNSIDIELLYNRHIKPYGYTGYKGVKYQSFSGLFEINKGLSEWQVLEKFCKDFLLKTPRVRPSNIIDFLDDYNDSGIVFSNKSREGICYSSLEQNYKRYKLISEVFIRSLKDGSYDNIISNQASINKGVLRKRYVNAVGDIKSPVFRGEQLIKDANKASFELKLTHPGPVVLDLLDKATIDDDILGVIPDLIASSITYKLSNVGEMCTLTFRKEQ